MILLLSSQFFFDASATITELKDQTFTSHLNDITVSGESNEYIITNCSFTGINYEGKNGSTFKAKVYYDGKLSIEDSQFTKCKTNLQRSSGIFASVTGMNRRQSMNKLKQFGDYGSFSLNQGIKTCTGGSSEEPTPKGCICQLSQSEQECACQENDQRQSCICLPIGDLRTHCIGHTIPSCDQATSNQLIDLSTDICECYSVGDPRDQCSSKTCDDPTGDMSNIPISLCPCNNYDDPRRGITCPVINECSNDSVSPKCLCISEHQSHGCICTQSIHPQQCICDNSSESLFPSNICSSTKTCSGSSGDDELITQGQCTCGFGHHPLGCLCKDSEDIDCFCNLEFSPTGCTCPSNSEFICTSIEH
ncbi:MAG: hypothetical protein EZS28_026986 [Streblomastix strix]|uniref:EGF-like domain-containing protein n=1 Tax=Streblomastix strix TaxID=222440 RepID=A0A5J4V4G0_9EUKA|nr:MAG: hypothetical protein EZS28_026986 [Streblomastix strix]